MWIRLCGNTFPCLVWSEILKIALFLFFQKPLKVLLQDAFCILKMIFDRSVNDPQEDIRRVLNLNLLRESHLPILTLFFAMWFSEIEKWKNKNLQVVSKCKCRQARLSVAKNFATIALTQASMTEKKQIWTL